VISNESLLPTRAPHETVRLVNVNPLKESQEKATLPGDFDYSLPGKNFHPRRVDVNKFYASTLPTNNDRAVAKQLWNNAPVVVVRYFRVTKPNFGNTIV
jgi:hypothetical protein